MLTDSSIPGFYQLSISERIDKLGTLGVLSIEEAQRLNSGDLLLSLESADKMIENVVGTFNLPFAVAPNFVINGREYLVPMVVEEPSIVAGVSAAAKTARASGGFDVEQKESLLAGQVQLVDIDDPDRAIQALVVKKKSLLDTANSLVDRLVARGGGVRDIEFFKYQLGNGRWTVVVHILVDTCDAMGANLVNSLCEQLSGDIEKLTGGKTVLRILSNLADRSLVTAKVVMPLESLATETFSSEEIRDRIVIATRLADVDPYRATTHNKGIMNGVDAVAIATGNDWRSIDAAAHAFAVKRGAYRSLSRWSVTHNGDLLGELTMPVKVGIVGGSLKANPGASLGLKIAAVSSAKELACMIGAVGIAQNFSALRALVGDGIQRGHMRLHARSVAASVGVSEEQFDDVVNEMLATGDVKAWKAEELLAASKFDLGGSATNAEEPWPGAGQGIAAGKVILLGEHAAVYDKHVLALPLAEAVVAQIMEHVSVTSLTVFEEESVAQIDLSMTGKSGFAAVLSLIMRRLKLDPLYFTIRIRSKIPAAMGLGSSAAYSVAIIRAFDDLFDLGLDDLRVNQLAFDCEKITHGSPSGIDNNLATFAEPVLFSKSNATRTRPLKLIEPPPLVVAASGVSASTLDQVAGVRVRYKRDPALYEMIFNEIDEMSLAGAEALRLRDYETLGALMNVCHGMLNAIEVSTPELEKMIQIARQKGAVGAKLTGSGGGGSIVALCPGREEEVAAGLRKAGFRVIRLGTAATRQ